MARIDEDADRVYFTDEEGTRWRVYDVSFGPPLCSPFRRTAFRPPDTRANYRYFVRSDGLERCHPFTDGEPRDLAPELVARQLAVAAYPDAARFDPATRTPRWR